MYLIDWATVFLDLVSSARKAKEKGQTCPFPGHATPRQALTRFDSAFAPKNRENNLNA